MKGKDKGQITVQRRTRSGELKVKTTTMSGLGVATSKREDRTGRMISNQCGEVSPINKKKHEQPRTKQKCEQKKSPTTWAPLELAILENKINRIQERSGIIDYAFIRVQPQQSSDHPHNVRKTSHESSRRSCPGSNRSRGRGGVLWLAEA